MEKTMEQSTSMSKFYETFYKYWLKGIQGANEQEEGATFLYVSLESKWKWFKPPLEVKIWKFTINFGWVYKIHKAYELQNCKPIPMNTDSSKDVEVEFSCNKVDNDQVDNKAEELNIKLYELHGEPVRETIKKFAEGPFTEPDPNIPEYERYGYTPKVKWFKPPLMVRVFGKFYIKFTWAYNLAAIKVVKKKRKGNK